MAGQTISVSVLADTQPFAAAMKNVGVGVGVALAAVGAGVVALGAAAFKAVVEIERLNAQTSAAIASTAGAAGRSIDQITGLADALERMSGVEAEVIQGAQNMLLTFTNIEGDNFDAATKAALDMSVAMGTDMTAAATLVGKALNDPIGGISALSRVGVQLTDSQKAAIQSMVDMGDVAGAQGVILAELGTQFGGSAEAFGGTFLGTLEKVKNSFGTLTEAFVVGLLPGATAALGGLNTLLLGVADSPAFASLVESVNGFVTTLFSGDSAIGGFIGTAVQLAATVSPLGIVFQALAPLLPELASLFGNLAQTIGGAVLGFLPTLTHLASTLAGVLGGVLAAVLPVVATLLGQVAGVLATLIPVIAPIVEIVGGALGTVLTTLGPIIATLATTIGGVLGTVLDALAPLLLVLAEAFVSILSAIMPLAMAVMPLTTAILSLIAPLAELVGAILTPLIALFVALLEPILGLIAPLVGMLTPAIAAVAGVLGVVVGAITTAIQWLVQLVTGGKTASKGFTDAFNGVGAFFGNLVSSVFGFFASLPDRIIGLFSGAGRWLYDMGRNIIDGLINGAGSLLRNLGRFFLDLVPEFIREPFKAALGIRSPSRVFAGYGRNVVQGLVNGLHDTAALDRAMAGLSGTVSSGFAPSGALSAPVITSSALAAPPSAAQAQPYVELSPADRTLLRDIRDAVGVTVNVGSDTVARAADVGSSRLASRGAG